MEIIGKTKLQQTSKFYFIIGLKREFSDQVKAMGWKKGSRLVLVKTDRGLEIYQEAEECENKTITTDVNTSGAAQEGQATE